MPNIHYAFPFVGNPSCAAGGVGAPLDTPAMPNPVALTWAQLMSAQLRLGVYPVGWVNDEIAWQQRYGARLHRRRRGKAQVGHDLQQAGREAEDGKAGGLAGERRRGKRRSHGRLIASAMHLIGNHQRADCKAACLRSMLSCRA